MADQQQQQGPTLRSRTRRTFDLSPSAESSAPPSPHPETNSLDIPESKDKDKDDGLTSRSRSVQNLTASTLFGIYSPTAFEGGGGGSNTNNNGSSNNTPWGTGAQTPSMRQAGIESSFSSIPEGDVVGAAAAVAAAGGVPSERYRRYTSSMSPSPSRRRGRKAGVVSLLGRSLMLFGFGVAYGVIVTHLHDSSRLAPVRVEGIDQGSWQYVLFWGVAGILLGSLLPWFDNVWEEAMGDDGEKGVSGARRGLSPNAGEEVGRRGLAADWFTVVRSVGAFVGIAFAIVSVAFFSTVNLSVPTDGWLTGNFPLLQRKLPWQSTLQVSLTLALVNPVLWYLIDRSKPGFMLSTVVGLAGMLVLLGINPEMVPPPATASAPSSMAAANSSSGDTVGWGALDGGISHEKIAVGTWIASVLFCSCVCFGNIGRRLALGGKGS